MATKTKKKKKKKRGGSSVSRLPVEKATGKRVEPDEWYTAKFEEADIDDGAYGEYVLIKFKLLGGYKEDTEDSAKGLFAVAFINLPVNPGSDHAKLAEGITGEEVEEDVDIDLTPFYGKKFKILISDKKNKKTKEVTQRITRIKSVKKKKK